WSGEGADPMAFPEPRAEMVASSTKHAAPNAWAHARRRLEDGRLYWLATVRSDARPHVMLVLAVWLDWALYFVARGGSRKARNLALNPECVVTVEVDDAHLVI